MSMLTCALSGSEPREPVVSLYGHLFEKSIIISHLRTNPHCPITHQPLTAEQLISISVPPRPVLPTTLPDLLSSLTSEFNALIEDRWKFQAALQDTRQQLAVSLFRVDAAARVIARLTTEKDDLLGRLAQVSAGASTTRTAAALVATPVVLPRALPSAAAAVAEATAATLQTARKEMTKTRKTEASSKQAVESFQEISESQCLHAHGGITALRIQSPDVVATIGRDLHAHVLRLDDAMKAPDLAKAQAVASLLVEGANITAAAFHVKLEVLYTADEEGKVVAWRGVEFSRTNVGQAVVGISVHPGGNLILVATATKLIMFEINAEGEIGSAVCAYNDLGGCVRAAAFHPDGLLMAVAVVDVGVVIFDIRSGEEVTRLQVACVSDLRFGENGYMLLTADETGKVILWDLRKSALIVELPNFAGGRVSVAIDESCQYIAVANGSDLRVFGFVSKTEVAEICSCETRQDVADMFWLPGARGLLAAGSAGKLALIASP
jgi:pre-mRNA-processing factor 19